MSGEAQTSGNTNLKRQDLSQLVSVVYAKNIQLQFFD